MSEFYLSPIDNNYRTSRNVFENYERDSQEVTLAAADVAASTLPKVYPDGSGWIALQGAVAIDTVSPSAGQHLCTLPARFVPLNNGYYPVTVLRSGAYVTNAVQIETDGASIASVIVDSVGSYATIPTLSASAPGSGATFTTTMQAVSAVPAAAGSGYNVGETITAAGGTSATAAVFEIATTELVSAAINAAGTGYTPGDVSTMTGGSASTLAQVTIDTTELADLTLNAAGSGYSGTDTITLTPVGGTTSTAVVITVDTVGGSGEILTFTITNPGVFTANASSFTQASTTGSGTGATFHIPVYAADAISITTAGVFTSEPTDLTQTTTTGSGTGLTLDTLSFGVNTLTVDTAGDYSALPSNPVSQASTSGSGTSATMTVSWGLLAVTVSNGGSGYTDDSRFVITGGGGEGGAGTLVLNASNSGRITIVNAPNDDDVVYLDNIQLLVKSY